MPYNGKHPAQIAVEMESVLSAFCQRFAIESLGVGLDIAGSRINLAYGPGARRLADAEAPTFAVGCMLDLIVSVLCLDLHFRAGLDLDAPIERYLPELGAEQASGKTGPVTIRHLLSRTSGVQDPRSIDEMRQPASWENLAPRIKAAPRIFSPGAAFSYGGIDRIVLAILIERFSGKPIARLVDEVILGPCRLTPRPEQLGEAGHDGLRPLERFNPLNLIAVAAALASEGPDAPDNPFGRGLRYYLQGERLQLSRSVRLPAWPHAPMAFTLGLFKYSDGLIGFNGFETGDSAAVRYDPMSQTAFAVGLKGPPQIRDLIVAEIAERLGFASVQSRARPCTLGGLNGLTIEDVAGDYQGWAAGYGARVNVQSGALTCELRYNDHLFRELHVAVEEEAWLVVETAEGAVPMEFYRDQGTGRVCLTSGFLPYVKLEP